MGKFFDTLKKMEKASTQPAVESVLDRAVPGSGEELEKLRLYPTSQPSVPSAPDFDASTADLRLVCLRDPASPAAETFRIFAPSCCSAGRKPLRGSSW